jgi:hypothetical protein
MHHPVLLLRMYMTGWRVPHRVLWLPNKLAQVWTAERSTQLGMAVSSMLKGYTTTAAQIITAMLKSVTKFTIQVRVLKSAVLLQAAIRICLRACLQACLRAYLQTSQM